MSEGPIGNRLGAVHDPPLCPIDDPRTKGEPGNNAEHASETWTVVDTRATSFPLFLISYSNRLVLPPQVVVDPSSALTQAVA